jgi:DNA-binding NarL/FixJ family response regulator
MKKEIKIFVVGGARGIGVYTSLKKKYVEVRYFRNEEDCIGAIHLNPDILIVDEDLKESDPMQFLSSIKDLSNAHVLFLSKDKHFNHIRKAFTSGASDYVLKDSYLYYSVHQFINRVLRQTNGLTHDISSYDCREESAFRLIHPVKFRLYQWFTHP